MFSHVLTNNFTFSSFCKQMKTSNFFHKFLSQGSGMKLGHSGRYYRETMDNIISINMTERGWRHLDGSSSHTGTLVPREEFLTVLGRVDRVLLRATYHLKQTSAR